MKVLIAGSRGIVDQVTVDTAIQESGFTISEVVSGGARGVDSLGEAWAKAQGIPVKRFLPDWKTYGKAAGPIRNSDMVAYAEAVIAIWDGVSPGTGDTIRKAQTSGKPVYIKYA